MRQPSQATATAASNRVHTARAVIRLSPVVHRNGLPFEWRERDVLIEAFRHLEVSDWAEKVVSTRTFPGSKKMEFGRIYMTS